MVVLVDTRPEEVTDFQRAVKGEVVASTFDRQPADHTLVAELAIERAKRLVELGTDVVVLLDSLTRLGRAYNLAAPANGRVLGGLVDSSAVHPTKEFFGAARKLEDAGSLTILATVSVGTGSATDEFFLEELAGTANFELVLSADRAAKGIVPAVDVAASGTRHEEKLLAPAEGAVVGNLRKQLAAADSPQAVAKVPPLLDFLTLGRRPLVIPQQCATHHLIVLIQKHGPMHLSRKADRPHIARLELRLLHHGPYSLHGRLPPILRVLLTPHRFGMVARVDCGRVGQDFSPLVDSQCLRARRTNINAQIDAHCRFSS